MYMAVFYMSSISVFYKHVNTCFTEHTPFLSEACRMWAVSDRLLGRLHMKSQLHAPKVSNTGVPVMAHN